MHWVCISNIYLSSNTRNIDKEFYVLYDCFTKKIPANPALLALAYAVSIAEERHPAANHFEENELKVKNYNDCVTTKKRFLDMFPIKRELTTKNFRYTKHKFYVTQKK
jgi:hypothetical protein